MNTVNIVYLKTEFGSILLSLHETIEGALEFRDSLIDSRNVQIDSRILKR